MTVINQAHGILGLEARFLWRGLVFNDLEASLPRTECRAVRGLYSMPEADNVTEKKTSQRGEDVFPSFSRGKTISYEMTAYASNAAELRYFCDLIRAQFGDQSNTYEMLHQPHPTYGTQEWGYKGRVLTFDMDEEVTGSLYDAISPYQINFSFSLRNPDGRYYDPNYVTFGPFAAGSTHVIPVTGRIDTEPVFTGTITDPDFPADIIFMNHSVTPPWYMLNPWHPDYPEIKFSATQGGSLLFGEGIYTLSLEDNSGSFLLTGETDPRDLWEYFSPFDSTWTLEGTPGLIPGNNSVEVDGLDNWYVSFRNRLP